MNFKKQLILTFSALSCISLGVAGVITYNYNANQVTALIVEDISNQLKGSESSIKIAAADNKARLEKNMAYWSPFFKQQLHFGAQTYKIEAENQVTHEKKSLEIFPMLLNGKNVADTPEVADTAAAQSNTAITFMQLHPDGLLRISTSLKKADGTRALGTFIPPSSPVYKTIAEGKTYMGRANVLGSWYSTAYEPLFQNGKVMGAFFMGFPETTTPAILADLKKKVILRTGYFYVLDKKGTYIAHPRLEGESFADMKDENGRSLFEKMSGKEEGNFYYTFTNKDGTTQEKMATFQYFPEMEWYLVASATVSEIQAQSHNLAWAILGISLCSILVMIVAGFIYGTKVSRYIASISKGLNANTEAAHHSIDDLTASVQDLSRSTSSSAASLEQTAASLEEVSSTIQNNAKSSANAAKLSSEAFNSAVEGAEQLRALIGSMKETGDSSKKIAEITGVIDSLAFQTNLLALNASVEAARAGEQGRSFAVVAEAVRNLAQHSASAAKDISNLIQEVTDRVQKGVNLADKSEVVLNKIVETTQQVAELSQEIASVTTEQSQGISQVNIAVARLEEDSQANARVANEVAEASAGIQVQVTEVETRAKDLETFIAGKAA